jgi:hypothetical protein
VLLHCEQKSKKFKEYPAIKQVMAAIELQYGSPLADFVLSALTVVHNPPPLRLPYHPNSFTKNAEISLWDHNGVIVFVGGPKCHRFTLLSRFPPCV